MLFRRASRFLLFTLVALGAIALIQDPAHADSGRRCVRQSAITASSGSAARLDLRSDLQTREQGDADEWSQSSDQLPGATGGSGDGNGQPSRTTTQLFQLVLQLAQQVWALISRTTP